MFCGAKQPTSPAVQPGLAKTAFGYSNEMMEQLRQAQPAPSPAAPSPAPIAAAPAPSPMPQARPATPSAPPPSYAQATLAGASPQQSAQPMPAPQPMPIAAPMPVAAAQQKTVMAMSSDLPSVQPSPSYAQKTVMAGPPVAVPSAASQLPTLAPSPDRMVPTNNPPAPMPYTPGGGGLAGYNPVPVGAPAGYNPQPVGGYNPQPVGAMAMQQQPYAPQLAPRGGVIDPWRQTLKTVMLVWGILVLVMFATPVMTEPKLTFMWNLLLDSEGSARIPFMLVAAFGALGVIVSLLGMPSAARAVFALVLGLAVIAVPFGLEGKLPPWQSLAAAGASLAIVTGLLLREAYTHSLLARILVTLGVAAFLVPLLLPQNGAIPIVELATSIGKLEGKLKVVAAIQLARVVLIAATLLVWTPGPATAGANTLAWLVILAIGLPITQGGGASANVSLLDVPVMLAVADHAIDIAKGAPIALVGWILPTACLVYISYGLATAFGKQLE